MKTTLELPDDLMRAVKIRAASEGRRLKDVVADAIRRGLTEDTAKGGPARRRVRLPLVECAHEAREMTPERIARILEKEDATSARQGS